MTKVNIFNLDSTGIRCLVTENRTACIVSKVGLRLNLHQQKSHQLLKSQQPLGACLRHQLRYTLRPSGGILYKQNIGYILVYFKVAYPSSSTHFSQTRSCSSSYFSLPSHNKYLSKFEIYLPQFLAQISPGHRYKQASSKKLRRYKKFT